MNDQLVAIRGRLMGNRLPTHPTVETEMVVEVTDALSAEAPGAGVPELGAIVLVAVSKGEETRARYLSWIGYADLDEASAAEHDRWTLIEPSASYTGRVSWLPFGWSPLERVWTHPPPTITRAGSVGTI